ncbi:hypothetical protein HMPREF6745_0018 [Prevotella sp. oral taxon 472 str. F0295]|nr:hypothetical protein HMPREF6745_0018 [Prevotella sp. oral taxon 472 str. F0295]
MPLQYLVPSSHARARVPYIYKAGVILMPWQWLHVFSLDRCSAGDCSA